ncbi:hypothetical protein [Arthrobacter tumbae]|uniref:hypothetical protein n=1 Tax=Arthrobacter tumbae TaxID=163874 RepID=UPI00195E1359|nr:hypothetical protein [Arthrobacter tumbae]MBM7781976.1 MFS family permease [Arthrobacter tumbae]
MPTPSNHRLPQAPPVPPRKNAEASPPQTETSTVLERLKAAQPKAPVSPGDEKPGTTTAAPPSAGPAGTTPSPTRNPDQAQAEQTQADQTQADADAREKAARAADLRAARAEKLKAASTAASTWAAKSGRQTAAWTATTSRSAAANVRSWRADQVRRNLVTLTVIGALVGTAAAAGFFGGPQIWTTELLRPDLSLVSPSLNSLYIWALIGLGMVAYTVHQWLPGQADSPRHRRLGWVVIAALLLNLALALTIQAELYAPSLVVHGVLLVLLMVSLRWLNRWSAATWLEGTLVDVPLGLLLGWTGFTALSHTAAFLSLEGFSWLTENEFAWALAGLGLVVVIGSAVCSMDRGRIAVALALVWGMGWIIVERLLGEPGSLSTAAATALAVFLVLITAGSRRHRVDHSYRRALRRHQTANLPPIDLADEDDDEYYDDEEVHGGPTRA